MTTFRIHFDNADPLDIDAETPKQAEAQAKVARPGALIRKIKVVKERTEVEQ